MAGMYQALKTAALPDYHTTEYKTGQKWIDGRDIYSITFTEQDKTLSTSGTATDYFVPGSIISNFTQIVNIEARWGIGSNAMGHYGSSYIVTPSVVSSNLRNFVRASYNANNGVNIYYNLESSIPLKSYAITLYYTKSV